MTRAIAVALAWMAGSLACHAAESQAPADAKPTAVASAEDRKPAGDTSPIPQDQKVVITVVDGRTLSVKPRFAIIRKHQPLKFAVEGLKQGQSVEIDFEVYEGYKGPFLRGENPYRGRYVLDERVTGIETRASDRAGYFEYHLVLRRGTEDVFALDPGVVVKNDF
jgi:hypothetical protein